MFGSPTRSGRGSSRGFLACIGLTLLVGCLLPVSAFAQNTKTSIEIPRPHRVLVQARIKAHDGDTTTSMLAGLDFARPGNPPSSIDATQLAEIAALTSNDPLKAGDRLFVAAASANGAGRQVVMHLSVSGSNGRTRFEIHLDDDGTYSKYYRPIL